MRWGFESPYVLQGQSHRAKSVTSVVVGNDRAPLVAS